MSELVTKVSSSSAPPVIPSTMTVQHDNVHVQMTSNKLDGMNYSGWSQFVKLYVTGKGKLRYLMEGRDNQLFLILFLYLAGGECHVDVMAS